MTNTMIHNTKRYSERFAHLTVQRLGGLEMAEEFFRLHPEMVQAVRTAAIYHYGKGGSAYKGALIFFLRTIKPQLAADRVRFRLEDLDGRN